MAAVSHSRLLLNHSQCHQCHFSICLYTNTLKVYFILTRLNVLSVLFEMLSGEIARLWRNTLAHNIQAGKVLATETKFMQINCKQEYSLTNIK